PAKEVLHIDISNPENLEGLNGLTIIDISGRAVETQLIAPLQQHGSTATINVSQLSKGVYLVKIGNERGKFVKE
ncbi:MAG: T9SS type A sorting domain-containing protein, partial [Tannerella sp.]|nr:T9SS type A sorting domain-containing protein [Tannerella sp.]